MTLYTWTIIIFMIIVNALYVAAEFSAVSVRRSKVHQLAEEGNALAKHLLPMISDTTRLDRYIAVSQIGITLSSLVLGAVGQARLAVELAPLFTRLDMPGSLTADSAATVLVLVALTIMQVVFAELVPKSLALQFPVRSALYTVLPMKWSSVIFSWFSTILNGSGWAILYLFRSPQSGHRHIHSPEEIDILLVESRDGGFLEPDEQERLHQALKLGVKPVHQLMVPRRRIEAVEITTPVHEVLDIIANANYSRMPVYRGSIDDIVGMISVKDVLLHYIENDGVSSIELVMRPVLKVPFTITVNRLLQQFGERHTQQAIVMDEFGGVKGLVTLEDILAEVFGDIGKQEPEPEELPDGRVRLPGLMHLEDAAQWIGVLWTGDSDTVGGHVMDELGHIPKAGEELDIDGVHVVVESLEDRIISSLIVTPVEYDSEEHNE